LNLHNTFGYGANPHYALPTLYYGLDLFVEQ